MANHKMNNALSLNEKILPAAVIFDMDGTLVATTEADFLAWQRIFIESGQQLSFEDYFPLLGKKSHDVVYQELKLSGIDAEAALQRKMKYFAEIVDEKRHCHDA
jgi:beta-phosphoglucomutase-like phosphatase (HAD superfamily)